ncbi:MAG: RnfH family protein [Burkholderiales bacterium]
MTLRVELVWAWPGEQKQISVELPEGARIVDAIQAAGLDPAGNDPSTPMANPGIWGRPASFESVLRDGDRIEFYRHLTADPKKARQQRAQRRRLSRKNFTA